MPVYRRLAILLIIFAAALAFPFGSGAQQQSATRTQKQKIYLGIDVFLAKHTGLVAGKRVGLVTNPTGVNGNLSATVDLLKADPRVNLVALFAPEHGIRGNVRAGENVAGGKDPVTGLPVYTLYGGKDHKPTPQSLAQIDVLIFDIQDVGSRAYTYIWHLAECMSACAVARKPVIVLDRPNIYGATRIDGPVSEKAYLSFIGLYPVPRMYGMTVGEFARYLNTEESIRCNLTVVPMAGYRRGMSWEETGLTWVPTSPNIPDVASALCFAATGGLGEVGCVNIGIGYTLPFQVVGATWMDAVKSAQALNACRLPGVRFRPIYYKPNAGMSKDKDLQGVQIHVTDPSLFLPATTEVAILCHLKRAYPSKFSWNTKGYAIFDKAMGTSQVRTDILAGKAFQEITAKWKTNLNAFDLKRKKYLIY